MLPCPYEIRKSKVDRAPPLNRKRRDTARREVGSIEEHHQVKALAVYVGLAP